ncbi:hypothetical protein SLS62_009445 [Diatrype stigma]|uniref:Uncharacterized protein n=1 Tax=Diatrype stigma TaxID=117547 RepID=A0AAN9UDC5_9PEZI
MSSPYVDELLISLKEYVGYGDLFLHCNDLKAAQRYDNETLTLIDDDPQAISFMLHYLYHLDYPEVQVNRGGEANVHQVPQANSPSDSNHLEKNKNGDVDKNHHPAADAINEPIHGTVEHSTEKGQSTHAAAANSPTGTGETSSEAGPKKSKKKKRRNTPVDPLSEPTATSPDAMPRAPSEIKQQQPPPSSTNKVPTLAGAPVMTATTITIPKAIAPNNKHQAPSPPPTTAPEPTIVATPSSSNSPNNLTIHAQLYALATKYGVSGLAALAADRFERGVCRDWATDEFLRAAREAYTSTDRGDRRLRDAVLGAVQAHPELLARPPVQDAIRGLELSFDLLMRMRGEGGGGANGVRAGSRA